MTWRELWRRFLLVLKPAPRTCPKCYEVGCTLTHYYSAHGVVNETWECDDCGARWTLTNV